MTTCPFCFINATRNPILYRGRFVVVILSNKRLMPGHTLVLPTRHVSTLTELSEEEFMELMLTARRFQAKIKTLWPDANPGCDLLQHDRPFMRGSSAAQGGLAVPEHLHIHLRPRTWKDEYYEKVLCHETSMLLEPSSEELQRMVNLLGE